MFIFSLLFFTSILFAEVDQEKVHNKEITHVTLSKEQFGDLLEKIAIRQEQKKESILSRIPAKVYVTGAALVCALYGLHLYQDQIGALCAAAAVISALGNLPRPAGAPPVFGQGGNPADGDGAVPPSLRNVVNASASSVQQNDPRVSSIVQLLGASSPSPVPDKHNSSQQSSPSSRLLDSSFRLSPQNDIHEPVNVVPSVVQKSSPKSSPIARASSPSLVSGNNSQPLEVSLIVRGLDLITSPKREDHHERRSLSPYARPSLSNSSSGKKYFLSGRLEEEGFDFSQIWEQIDANRSAGSNPSNDAISNSFLHLNTPEFSPILLVPLSTDKDEVEENSASNPAPVTVTLVQLFRLHKSGGKTETLSLSRL